jgi:hypothetical protein
MAHHIVSCIIRKDDLSVYKIHERIRYMNEYVYCVINKSGDVILSDRNIGGQIINNRFTMLAAKAVFHFATLEDE